MKSVQPAGDVFVGLDYAQNGVQVCVLDPSGDVRSNRLIANDWQAIVKAAESHGSVRRVAIESCCGAADLAEELVQRAGWSVDLAHPGFVKRMKQNPDKTDFADARMLADLTRVGYLPRVWLVPAAIRDLRQLTRHRQQLVNNRRAIKTRILAMLREARVHEPPGCTRWYRPWMTWLTTSAEVGEHARWVIDQHLSHLKFLGQQIESIMRRLRQITADDPVVAKLRSLPGVGEVTACTLRAEIGRFDRFVSGKQLARFCGLSPRNASSGERQADAGLIRAANGALRAIIIETAHRLGRLDPRWNAMRERLRARGKPGSVIAGAIGNRWTRWLYQEIRKMNTPT